MDFNFTKKRRRRRNKIVGIAKKSNLPPGLRPGLGFLASNCECPSGLHGHNTKKAHKHDFLH